MGQMDLIENSIRIMWKLNRFLKKDFDKKERNMRDKKYDEVELMR